MNITMILVEFVGCFLGAFTGTYLYHYLNNAKIQTLEEFLKENPDSGTIECGKNWGGAKSVSA